MFPANGRTLPRRVAARMEVTLNPSQRCPSIGRIFGLFTIFTLSSLAACGHGRAPTGVATPTSALLPAPRGSGLGIGLPPGQGIERVAMGRCERLATCSKLGRQEVAERRLQCLRETKREMNVTLRTHGCVPGVDRDRLDDCLIAIRAVDCSVDLRTVQGIGECRLDYLCS
jgi:hypothetical protein